MLLRRRFFDSAGAPGLLPEFYNQFISEDMKIIYNETYNLLSNTDVAVVTSGTATLETALFEVPEVVCYKGSSISYQIAKKLIKISEYINPYSNSDGKKEHFIDRNSILDAKINL